MDDDTPAAIAGVAEAAAEAAVSAEPEATDEAIAESAAATVAAAAAAVALAETTAAEAELQAAHHVAATVGELDEWRSQVADRLTATEAAQSTILAQLSELQANTSSILQRLSEPPPEVIPVPVEVTDPLAVEGAPPAAEEPARRPRHRWI